MKYSILDQSPVRSGISPDQAIRESIALAQACERFGYHRYWMSEHHGSDAVAGTAPEILAAAIAATTKTIRVGSAGVMLPHYSALKVAEQFRVLEAIAPGRIDLGVGRAPGTDGRTAMALNPNALTAADHFPAQFRDLAAWVSGQELPVNHPFRKVIAEPRGPFAPELWMLGSSDYGAQVAAYFGLPYCFAYFFNEGAGAERALAIYRANFQPSALLAAPHAAIVVWALGAETRQEADFHFLGRGIQGVMRDRGTFIPIPTPEAAAAFEMTEAERAKLARLRENALCGSAAEVAQKLRELALEMQVAEMVITTTAFTPEARENSYALLARELGLRSPLPPAT